jgi:FtsZ-interacting cell division protein ZipA
MESPRPSLAAVAVTLGGIALLALLFAGHWVMRRGSGAVEVADPRD